MYLELTDCADPKPTRAMVTMIAVINEYAPSINQTTRQRFKSESLASFETYRQDARNKKAMIAPMMIEIVTKR